ncbi:MAG: FAD-dependent oxidoreductase [Clostridia bacterium]|nr:FAD-dependent oxidoreductase [Clostridia bacterium]
MIYDVIVAGAGVIGGMVARELTKYKLNVCILEKESDVACGASKANSGIIHGGFDPEPETLKAKMNTAGISKLYETAKMLHVPHKQNGSLVCAFGEEEEPAIHELYERGLENGIQGMSILTGDEARALEPELSEAITLVLNIPSAGIICPYELTIAAVGNAMDNGATLKTNFEIAAIQRANGIYTVTAKDGQSVQGRFVVNCAGAYSDKISAMVGDDSFTIIPRAGEYLLLDKSEGVRVSRTIFQVPSKEGKGILVSPTVDNNLLTGPTALRVRTSGSTETTDDGLAIVRNLSKKSVPGVDYRQVITSFSGVRASVATGDFIIEPAKNAENFVNVAAIDSPGLTSCVAIAEYAVEILGSIGLELLANPAFDGTRPDPHFIKKMSDEEKSAYIAEHPAYGRIICRCEMVSEGEIRDAIRRNPPAHDVDGVKRRTRSGMGRCQGGFCMPYVMKLIAEENGVPMEQVTKKGKDSNLATGRI